MKCLGCSSEKIFARGYCSACYYRLRRNGTLVRKHMSNVGLCSVLGCTSHAFAKGFCSLHYQQKRHHPLRSIWKNLRSRDNCQPSWENFEVFLSEVGERPTPKHQLRRINTLLPWSATNSKWLAPVGLRANDAGYKRRWHLKNKRGLADGAEEAMFAAQDGKCAICQLTLGRTNEGGAIIKTCVDHNHKTNFVRGLLCDPCNKGLGQFNDDLGILRKAVSYLEKDNGQKS